MSDDDEDDDAAFEAGFNQVVAAKQLPVAEKQQPEAKPKPEQEPAPEGSGAAAATGAGATPQPEAERQPSPAPNAPATAKPAKGNGKLTPEEVENLKALALKVPEQDRQLSRAFGTIGELQQQLKTLRANGDARIEPPKPPPRLTGEALVVKRLQEQAMADLEEDFPDWRDIVGAPKEPDEQPNPNHPFRRWLATKDNDYQQKINNSNSARQIAKAIETFKAETAVKPKGLTPPKAPQTIKAKVADGDRAAAARRDRIASAVPPRTTAGKTPIRARTDDDDFNEGFAQESRR